jgi:hypothetical protein
MEPGIAQFPTRISCVVLSEYTKAEHPLEVQLLGSFVEMVLDTAKSKSHRMKFGMERYFHWLCGGIGARAEVVLLILRFLDQKIQSKENHFGIDLLHCRDPFDSYNYSSHVGRAEIDAVESDLDSFGMRLELGG